MSKMTVVMSKPALLDHLGSILKAAQKEDEKAKEKHTQDENFALEKFRRLLREAEKWDYKTLKKHYFEVGLKRGEQPDCPDSAAEPIKRVIRMVKLDKREQFSISPLTDLYAAINWLHEAERHKGLCK